MEVNFISTYVALESQGHLFANRLIAVQLCARYHNFGSPER
jgi:hypothetical protein